jgi:hypothetical protein
VAENPNFACQQNGFSCYNTVLSKTNPIAVPFSYILRPNFELQNIKQQKNKSGHLSNVHSIALLSTQQAKREKNTLIRSKRKDATFHGVTWF